jgi:hypothetical protein
MKIFLVNLFLISLVLGLSDANISFNRIKRNAGFGSYACQIATRVEKYNCANDACRKWQCYSGTTMSFCKKTWEEMDCTIASYNKKCNAADQQSLRDYYNSVQTQYESGRCKQYPRNNPIDINEGTRKGYLFTTSTTTIQTPKPLTDNHRNTSNGQAYNYTPIIIAISVFLILG